jgi:hypothetical protein
MDESAPTDRSAVVFLLLGLCFVAAGVAVAADTWLSRVVLHADEIVVRDLRLRRLRREEIKGRRLTGQTTLILEKHSGGSIRIPLIIDRDELFDRWVRPLPDLDAIDRAASEEQLRSFLANNKTGANDLRLGRLSAHVLNGASVVILAWAWAFPRPYGAAVLANALLPVAALVVIARFRGIVGIDSSRHDPRPNVALALIFPSCVLGLRALDYAVIDLVRLFSIGVPIGLVPAGVGAWLDPSVKRRWLTASLFGVINVGYGVGGACLANSLLDSSEPVVYRSEVLGKRISRGKHTEYNLALAPWGPVEEREQVRVPRQLFDQLAKEDWVDVSLHEGALGMRWFRVKLPEDHRPRPLAERNADDCR